MKSVSILYTYNVHKMRRPHKTPHSRITRNIKKFSTNSSTKRQTRERVTSTAGISVQVQRTTLLLYSERCLNFKRKCKANQKITSVLYPNQHNTNHNTAPSKKTDLSLDLFTNHLLRYTACMYVYLYIDINKMHTTSSS